MRLVLFAAAGGLALAACQPPDGDADGGGRADASFEEALAALELTEDTAEDVGWGAYERQGGRAVFTDLVGETDDPDGDWTAAQLVVANPRMEDGQPVFDLWEMTEFASGDDDHDMTVALVRLAAPNARTVQALMEAGDDDDDENATGDDAGAAASDEDPGSEADFSFSDLAFDQFLIEGVDVDIHDDESEGVLRLDSFELSALEEGALDAASMEGFAFDVAGEDETGEPFSVSASFAAARIDNFYARSLDLFSAIDGDPGEFAELLTELQQEQMAGAFDVDGEITDFLMDLNGVEAAMPALRFSNETRGETLTTVTDLPEITVTANPEAGFGAMAGQWMQSFGYETINLASYSEQVWERDSDRLHVEDYWIEMENGFRLDLVYDVDGYGAYMETMGEAATADSMRETEIGELLESDEIRLRGFSLRLEDRGLVDNVLAGVAAMQGSDVETMRSQAVGFVALGSAFAPPNAPRGPINELSAALTGFIQNPGVLTIEMNPDAPVSMAALRRADGTYDAEALNFSASAE